MHLAALIGLAASAALGQTSRPVAPIGSLTRAPVATPAIAPVLVQPFQAGALGGALTLTPVDAHAFTKAPPRPKLLDPAAPDKPAKAPYFWAQGRYLLAGETSGNFVSKLNGRKVSTLGPAYRQDGKARVDIVFDGEETSRTIPLSDLVEGNIRDFRSYLKEAPRLVRVSTDRKRRFLAGRTGVVGKRRVTVEAQGQKSKISLKNLYLANLHPVNKAVKTLGGIEKAGGSGYIAATRIYEAPARLAKKKYPTRYYGDLVFMTHAPDPARAARNTVFSDPRLPAELDRLEKAGIKVLFASVDKSRGLHSPKDSALSRKLHRHMPELASYPTVLILTATAGFDTLRHESSHALDRSQGVKAGFDLELESAVLAGPLTFLQRKLAWKYATEQRAYTESLLELRSAGRRGELKRRKTLLRYKKGLLKELKTLSNDDREKVLEIIRRSLRPEFLGLPEFSV